MQGPLSNPMSAQSTIVCPYCQTLLSYPSGVGVIQCPSCQNTIDLNSPALQGSVQQPLGMSLNQLQMLQNQQNVGVGGQLQTRCNGCSSLLAYPASSLLVQCPQCLKTQDPRQNGMYNPMMNTMMMNSPMVHQQMGGKFASPGSGQKPLKKRKDPNAPKAVRNAYMIFCQQQRAKLKASNPELSFGKLGGKMGEQWRTMSAEEKKPYEKLAMEDRERYRSEMLRFQQTGNCKPAGEQSQKRSKAEANDNIGAPSSSSSSPSVSSPQPDPSSSSGLPGEDSKGQGTDLLNNSVLAEGDDDSQDLDGEDGEGDDDGADGGDGDPSNE